MVFTFHIGLLKASFNGICAWSKCSYVYNSKANNSSIYNDNGVFLGKAETHPTYNRQVNLQTCYFTLHLYYFQHCYPIAKKLKIENACASYS